MTAEIRERLRGADLEAIIICPSNPYISVDPILSVPGLRQLIEERPVPVVAVSPIIGDAAVKGPAAKMMRELGFDVSSKSIAAHYRGLVDALVIDLADAALKPAIEAMGIQVRVAPTLMRSPEDRRALGDVCVEVARALIEEKRLRSVP
jgi:LPPG:FO 2-phospho-L-lactate transferase